MLILLVLLAYCEALMHIRDPSTWESISRSESVRSSPYKWSEEWLDGVPLDHFAFANKDQFKLRYFINTDSYEEGGPIFFYTGNEGKLEGFAENTGFMWDIAPEFHAAVVFAEHRFYGRTQPYGATSYNTTDHLGYLSSEQALADFVLLIDHLKQKRIPGAENSPVIAFGGSYGGMLAAWIRTKYPHKVAGAIAASAPVFWFVDSHVPEDIYAKIVTRSFLGAGCNRKAIERGWRALKNLAKTEKGRAYLNELFHLEEKSRVVSDDDHKFLASFVREVFESMAMVNYPYPSEFLAPLPGWPVKEACKFLGKVQSTDEDAARQLYEVTNLYYNYTGTTKSFCANADRCEGAFAALGDPMGWPWQTCTEMVMPICASGWPNDFFWKDCPYTMEGAIENCEKWFGKVGFKSSMLRPHWPSQNYGTEFSSASNIVFSNGFLDPWSGGGWSMTPKIEGSLVSIILKEGAHHYDLRGTHPDDTEEVKNVREQEKAYIKKWIQKAKMRKN
uniref:Peptidase S28 domain containing protein n=1 Tax=Haemonchus contortus TaxID=6289 RepID=W6NDI6_HAECO